MCVVINRNLLLSKRRSPPALAGNVEAGGEKGKGKTREPSLYIDVRLI